MLILVHIDIAGISTPNCILSFVISSISSMHTTLYYQPRHPLSPMISPKKVFVNGSRALLRLMIRYSVHILPLLPLTPIDDTSQLMLLSAKSFKNCSHMLGLVILKTGIYHIGQRQLNSSLRSTKSVTESRKSE